LTITECKIARLRLPLLLGEARYCTITFFLDLRGLCALPLGYEYADANDCERDEYDNPDRNQEFGVKNPVSNRLNQEGQRRAGDDKERSSNVTVKN
jgi:hypothetical protein